jgi:hypothetical protein
MTQKRRGEAHVRRIGDRKDCGGGVAEEMRIEGDPEMIFRPRPDSIVKGDLRHRRRVSGNPKRGVDRTSPASGSRFENRSVDDEVCFEGSAQDVR